MPVATAPPALIALGPATCADLDSGTAREWLLTDGLGGYAMGTVSGLRTRRYHGLLVVATSDGRPVLPGEGISERHLALASLDPVLVLGDRRVRLATHEWSSAAVDPAGAGLLSGVELRPGTVACRWVVGDVVIERELAMLHGRPGVAVAHRVVRAPGEVRLELSALGTWRDAHGDRHAGGADPRMELVTGGAVVENVWRVHGPGFVPGGSWYLGVRYREEAARGLADTEDLWHLGTFAATLAPGSSLDVLAWAADDAGLAATPPPASRVIAAARDRAAAALAAAALAAAGSSLGGPGGAPGGSPASFPGGSLGSEPDPARRLLVLAADQFVTGGPGTAFPTGVVAGYPWFGEWSRDTLTSYPGLFLATGRHAEGAALLRRYADAVDQGMLPNTADAGIAPAGIGPLGGGPAASPWGMASAHEPYPRLPEPGLPRSAGMPVPRPVRAPAFNSVDAALWFLVTVARHVTATGDVDLAAELVPVLIDIVDHHLLGTRYGIRVDPGDGLLRAGVLPDDPDLTAGLALTWMDARVGGLAVTPRHGKPVEVNALWISGLAGLLDLLAAARRPRSEIDRIHRLEVTARASFLSRFVDGSGTRTGVAGALLDVVDGPAGDDPSLRPNQLLAASLPGGPVRDPAAAARLVGAVAPLLTPLGLRTLAPSELGYRGRHRGTPQERDAAYHQGTVWPWLVGPYTDAAARAGLPTDGVLDGLRGHLAEAGVGSISETADGDEPHLPTGCPFQAWSVAETLRVLTPAG